MGRRQPAATERPYCENGEYIAFARRIMRAVGRRASADLDMLPGLGQVQAELDAMTVEAIVGARAANYSWAEIAQRLGTTRQAVHQRYAARVVQRQAEIDAERAAVELADEGVSVPTVEPIDLNQAAGNSCLGGLDKAC